MYNRRIDTIFINKEILGLEISVEDSARMTCTNSQKHLIKEGFDLVGSEGFLSLFLEFHQFLEVTVKVLENEVNSRIFYDDIP